MMSGADRLLLAIVGSVIGLATLSVILSNQAQTSNVIKAATGGLSTVIGAATAPVTGTSGSLGLSGTSFNPLGILNSVNTSTDGGIGGIW